MRVLRLLIAAGLVITGLAAGSSAAGASTPPTRGGASLVVNISPEDQPVLGGDSFAWAGNTESTVVAKRLSTGRYRFTIPGLATGKGEVNLTTIHDPSDPSNDPICTVSTISVGSSSTRIYVNCFDAVTGKPAPGRHFALLYSTLQVPNPFDTAALVHLRTGASTYSHTPANQWRSAGTGKMKVHRTDKGLYDVTIPALGWTVDQGIFVVNALGSSPRWCVIEDEQVSATFDWTVSVACFRIGGSLADSKFSLIGSLANVWNTPGQPGGGQQIVLPDGPGPFELTTHRSNTAQKANWAQWLPAKEATVVVFEGVLLQAAARTTIVGTLGVNARCAVSRVIVFSFYRYVPVRCVDPAGVAVKSPAAVLDVSLVG